MSELIFEHKHRHKNYIIGIKIYKVSKDKWNPEGFHYSLVLTKDEKRILGYDNHERKWHHVHKGSKEMPYEFVDEWKLIEDLYKDVEKMTQGKIK